jgi:hypothetical protein
MRRLWCFPGGVAQSRHRAAESVASHQMIGTVSMTASTARTEIPFDHHSVEYAADPGAIAAALHQHDPVFRSPAHGGFWVVTSQAAVGEVEAR